MKLFILLALMFICFEINAQSFFDKKAEKNINSEIVTDIDGNQYRTITIGNQIWLAEDLKTTRYRNGDSISNVTNNKEWVELNTEAFCNYSNDPFYVATFGRLYNWYAVNDRRNIAPKGWHVPTDEEWQTLIDFLGGWEYAGGKLKESSNAHWRQPNKGATNEVNFSAWPGGSRCNDGRFYYMGEQCFWWTSTSSEINGSAKFRSLYHDGTDVTKNSCNKFYGLSVRCVKGELPSNSTPLKDNSKLHKDVIPKTIKDIDGNVYHTAVIGNQVWMVENLKTTKYRNGDPIPNLTERRDWFLGTNKPGAFCYYNNDKTNGDIYGYLYNGYAVYDSRNIAPEGWHVATEEDWKELIKTLLDKTSLSGLTLRESGDEHWINSNGMAQNEFGFTAMPGGYIKYGDFQGINHKGVWWGASSTRSQSDMSPIFFIESYDIVRTTTYLFDGLSVRCVMDR